MALEAAKTISAKEQMGETRMAAHPLGYGQRHPQPVYNHPLVCWPPAGVHAVDSGPEAEADTEWKSSCAAAAKAKQRLDQERHLRAAMAYRKLLRAQW